MCTIVCCVFQSETFPYLTLESRFSCTFYKAILLKIGFSPTHINFIGPLLFVHGIRHPILTTNFIIPFKIWKKYDGIIFLTTQQQLPVEEKKPFFFNRLLSVHLQETIKSVIRSNEIYCDTFRDSWMSPNLSGRKNGERMNYSGICCYWFPFFGMFYESFHLYHHFTSHPEYITSAESHES